MALEPSPSQPPLCASCCRFLFDSDFTGPISLKKHNCTDKLMNLDSINPSHHGQTKLWSLVGEVIRENVIES
jgi:hypothetical protein